MFIFLALYSTFFNLIRYFKGSKSLNYSVAFAITCKNIGVSLIHQTYILPNSDHLTEFIFSIVIYLGVFRFLVRIRSVLCTVLPLEVMNERLYSYWSKKLIVIDSKHVISGITIRASENN